MQTASSPASSSCRRRQPSTSTPRHARSSVAAVEGLDAGHSQRIGQGRASGRRSSLRRPTSQATGPVAPKRRLRSTSAVSTEASSESAGRLRLGDVVLGATLAGAAARGRGRGASQRERVIQARRHGRVGGAPSASRSLVTAGRARHQATYTSPSVACWRFSAFRPLARRSCARAAPKQWHVTLVILLPARRRLRAAGMSGRVAARSRGRRGQAHCTSPVARRHAEHHAAGAAKRPRPCCPRAPRQVRSPWWAT